MTRSSRRALLPLCLLLPLVYAFEAGAFVGSFTEDFTSKEYCDTLNTTAWWDTTAGELKLHPFEPTLVGTYDTPFEAVQVVLSGDYAFVADDLGGVQVIDVSDPASPTYAGSYLPAGPANAIALSGDYAYVAVGSAGLRVLDISDPTNPSLAGSLDTSGLAEGITISGDYAFVADWTAGLQVIDISNPLNPTWSGDCDTPGAAMDVAVAGDYAYVADRSAGLQVVDITSPASPVSAGTYDTPGDAWRVTVAGDYAYVGDGSSGLQVIDISDPTNPGLAGIFDTPGIARGVAVSGDYAYVGDHGAGVQILDISDPTAPACPYCYNTTGTAYGVTIAGEYVLAADGSAGLKVIRIADPSVPTNVGSGSTPLLAYGIAIAGDYAYIACGHNELSTGALYVFDISSPAAPAYAGEFGTSDPVFGVAISGDYIYLTGRDGYGGGLKVLDISNPTHPVYAGGFGTSDPLLDISISGNHAYVGWGNLDGLPYDGGLYILDISDPTVPAYAGGISTPYAARGIAISGDNAFVAYGAAGDGGLRILDISDPTAPTYAGGFTTSSSANGITISGNYAYVAWGEGPDGGLEVLDISDPTAPAAAGSAVSPFAAHAVAVSCDRAYLVYGDNLSGGGISVLDISDPTDPLIADSAAMATGARDVVVSGDNAYVAALSSGLQVFRVLWRQYFPNRNTARSLPVAEPAVPIEMVRLTSTQIDTVRWEVSADGGTHWESLSNQVARHLSYPGQELLWRCTLVPPVGYTSSLCSSLEIEWFLSDPRIVSVSDVADDQGHQVRLSWVGNGYDTPGSPAPVTHYAVFRRIDQVASTSSGPVARLGRSFTPAPAIEVSADGLTYPPGNWDFVTTVPACCENYYSTLVTTLVDSTATEGIRYSVFFVRAATATPGVYFDSPPDSGYSIDNLAPPPPENLVMPTEVDLAWEESDAEDFNYFTVYGSSNPDLDSTATLIDHTSGITMDVTGEVHDYYHVTATDFSGNEGDASSVGNQYAGVMDNETLPVVFALRQNEPNPFDGSTLIRFDVPGPSAVSIKVYDAGGRLVKTLARGSTEPGRHSVEWTGDDSSGNPTGPGLYFIKMEAVGFTATNKMLLMR